MELTTWVRAQWDRVLAGALAVGGLVALLVGWLGVSSTPYLAEQLPYLVSAGLLGLFLLGLSASVWISADLRDEWRKLDEVADLLSELRPDRSPDEGRSGR